MGSDGYDDTQDALEDARIQEISVKNGAKDPTFVSDEQWTVKEILAERNADRTDKPRQFKVVWDGFDENGREWAPSWEPCDDFPESHPVVMEFRRAYAKQTKREEKRRRKEALRNADIRRARSLSSTTSPSAEESQDEQPLFEPQEPLYEEGGDDFSGSYMPGQTPRSKDIESKIRKTARRKSDVPQQRRRKSAKSADRSTDIPVPAFVEGGADAQRDRSDIEVVDDRTSQGLDVRFLQAEGLMPKPKGSRKKRQDGAGARSAGTVTRDKPHKSSRKRHHNAIDESETGSPRKRRRKVSDVTTAGRSLLKQSPVTARQETPSGASQSPIESDDDDPVVPGQRGRGKLVRRSDALEDYVKQRELMEDDAPKFRFRRKKGFPDGNNHDDYSLHYKFGHGARHDDDDDEFLEEDELFSRPTSGARENGSGEDSVDVRRSSPIEDTDEDDADIVNTKAIGSDVSDEDPDLDLPPPLEQTELGRRVYATDGSRTAAPIKSAEKMTADLPPLNSAQHKSQRRVSFGVDKPPARTSSARPTVTTQGRIARVEVPLHLPDPADTVHLPAFRRQADAAGTASRADDANRFGADVEARDDGLADDGWPSFVQQQAVVAQTVSQSGDHLDNNAVSAPGSNGLPTDVVRDSQDISASTHSVPDSQAQASLLGSYPAQAIPQGASLPAPISPQRIPQSESRAERELRRKQAEKHARLAERGQKEVETVAATLAADCEPPMAVENDQLVSPVEQPLAPQPVSAGPAKAAGDVVANEAFDEIVLPDRSGILDPVDINMPSPESAEQAILAETSMVGARQPSPASSAIAVQTLLQPQIIRKVLVIPSLRRARPPPERPVLETSQKIALARNLIRLSHNIDAETRTELCIYLEAPAYYGTSDRKLTSQLKWEFELGPAGATPADGDWVLTVRLETHDWELRRLGPATLLNSEDPESADQEIDITDNHVLGLYDELLTAHNELQQQFDRSRLNKNSMQVEIDIGKARLAESTQMMQQLTIANTDLEAQLIQARSTLTKGIEQMHLAQVARFDQMRTENERLKQQNEFLQRQALATQDQQLRTRAAQALELEATNTQLTETLAQQAGVIAELSDQLRRYQLQAAQVEAERSAIASASVGGAPPAANGNDVGPDQQQAGTKLGATTVPPAVIGGKAAGIMHADAEARLSVLQVPQSRHGVAAPLSDLSGDTTEATPSVNLSSFRIDSQGAQQQEVAQLQSELSTDEVLELDSGTLESQLAYQCEWGQAQGAHCQQLFPSQQLLFSHVKSHI